MSRLPSPRQASTETVQLLAAQVVRLMKGGNNLQRGKVRAVLWMRADLPTTPEQTLGHNSVAARTAPVLGGRTTP